MSKIRWLILLLVISWTLNVAFIVTCYLRTCGSPGFPGACPVIPPHLKEDALKFPDNFRDNMRRDVEPLHRELSRLIGQISLSISADTLDTVRVYELSDSLDSVRSELQHRMITNLCRNYDKLPPAARHRLSKRLYGMMENHLRRMPCEREPRKPHSKRFRSNRQEKQDF
ncbi:MAG: hypothetical protein HQ568_04910 [Calditrichaeota bacterium]|nr:hypothetical protein [Calditrichota bacterium]